jgi:hypothetical protein
MNIFDKKKDKQKKKYILSKEKLATNIFLDKMSLSDLNEHDCIHILTDGLVKLIDVIEYLLKDKKESELYIATLSFDGKTLDRILKLYDNKVLSKIRMIRCNLYVGERASLYEQARNELEKRGQKILGINSHCKVFLIDKNITITGSMNLTANNLMENLTITKNIDTYNFYKRWFDVSFQEE